MEIDVSKCEFYDETSFCNAYRDCDGDWFKKCTDVDLNNCYYKQLHQLKQENDELKKLNKMLSENNAVQQWADMYNKKDKDHFDCQLKLALAEQKLEKLKPILEYYANSKVGEEQSDGTYIVEIGKCTGDAIISSFGLINNGLNPTLIHYDPRPAKEGLRIIESEE